MTTFRAPYNWVQLDDGDEAVFTPARYDVGRPAVAPYWATPGRPVEMVRVWVLGPPENPRGAYLDFAAARLVAILPAVLATVAGSGRRVHIRAAGAPPRTEYTVTTGLA